MLRSVSIVAALWSAVTLASVDASATQDGARKTPLSRKLAKMAAAAPLAVGHRGASASHPENTLPAFRAAVAAGAQMVELDFRQTADGELVCLHDATLDRTTDSNERGRRDVAVADVEAAALRDLDAGSWKGADHADTRIPSLAQALDVIQAGSITMIEHKAGDPERLVALLRAKKLVDQVLVQSFDWDWLERVHGLEPRLTIGALGSGALTPGRMADVARTGASMVHWSSKTLRIEDIAELRRRGYLVCVYTVNGDVGLLGATAIGCELITTDDPGHLQRRVAQGHLER